MDRELLGVKNALHQILEISNDALESKQDPKVALETIRSKAIGVTMPLRLQTTSTAGDLVREQGRPVLYFDRFRVDLTGHLPERFPNGKAQVELTANAYVIDEVTVHVGTESYPITTIVDRENLGPAIHDLFTTLFYE